MNHIEKLIKELCPNGVEFRKLGTLGKRNKGTSITASRMRELFQENGEIRIFAGGKTFADVSAKSIPKKDIVYEPSIIVKSRGFIGFEYFDKPFSHKSELWSYTINNEKISQKFVYYFLITKEPYLQRLARATSVKLPQLSVRDTDTLEIPVPPLEVQREIVRILDNFTELEVELEAELEARRKQYEFYRDQLLYADEHGVMNSGVQAKWTSLGNFAEIYDGTHQTPKYKDKGVQFVSVENINNLYGSKKYISLEDYAKLYRHKPEIGDLLMTRIGTIGVCSIVSLNQPLAYYVTLALMKINNNIALTKFVKYVIESKIGKLELYKRTLINAVPIKINLSDISKICLPLPPLAEQQRIVAILDKFDALVNNISQGLPAEIAARRKQYEFYRDKLLTFTPKVEVKEVADV